ncbi:MAG: hypothetical protein E7616_01875 [Ruminococcaceae bacterium]|nr:hypothetical protein [Oscillospiraceae bacterium]
MEINAKNNKNQYIDISYILKALWRKAWIIAVVTVLVGGIFLTGTVFFVTPKYSASVIMYVNNSAIDLGNMSLSQLDAARNRVNSYLVILTTRTTLEQVIDKSGVNYTYEQLRDMITASPVNDTEFFAITVTSSDPYEAAKIANVVDDVLCARTEDIIEGTDVRTVDHAIVNREKVAPSITLNTTLGLVLGFAGACAVLATLAVLDDTIRDEEYILQTYDLPILAKIPDLLDDSSSDKYSYYSDYRSNDHEDK